MLDLHFTLLSKSFMELATGSDFLTILQFPNSVKKSNFPLTARIRFGFAYPQFLILMLYFTLISFRRKNNRATAENALARLRDLLELKEFNQDADEVVELQNISKV